ncbi:MAG: UDP-N-acetylmuramoyl-L-alanyl-D-glutamate--2,6-diaminopimelate ligase [Candidatus Omnitrophota bacterium]
MKIKELVRKLKLRYPAGLADFTVAGVSCNSKTVLEDFIFVAIKGAKNDGSRFIAEAVRNGARLVIAEGPVKNIPFVEVRDTRKALAELAGEFYAHPSRKIKVIGVTGTNGKTTITYLIEAMLIEAKLPSGVIGTVNYRFKDTVIPAKNTTPGPVEIEALLAQMLQQGLHYCLMEVSSHALDQGRVRGLDFNSAIFTNLTQDHLDYHKNMEHYFQSKALLFKSLRPSALAVINGDCVYAKNLINHTRAKVITYGIENKAQVFARNIQFDRVKSEFDLVAPKLKTRIVTGLIGRHNVYNALAGIAWALQEGIDITFIKEALAKFSCAPGRLEQVRLRKDFSVFVDYAHTDDALKNVIESLRQLTQRKLIVVFGCGGERDKLKRPKMGRVVSEMSDYAIITSDNPRGEDPQEIIRDIQAGIRKQNYCVIPERLKAIKKSLSIAKAGDIVLVAGKGHENYQIIKDKVIPFDDREAVKLCLGQEN